MKRSWLIAGAVAGCLSGAAAGACGSSTGAGGAGASGVTAGSTTSAAHTTGTGSGTVTTGAVNPTTSSGNPAGGAGGQGGGTCKPPTMLHPPAADAGAETLYCPFSAVDGGKNDYCNPATEHCCEPSPSGLATCDPTATACGATDVDWECEDPVSDCKDNTKPVCCAVGASIGLGGACANFAHTMHGTTCVAAGTCTNGIIMCTSSAECPASAPTCTPFGKAGNQVGGCM